MSLRSDTLSTVASSSDVVTRGRDSRRRKLPPQPPPRRTASVGSRLPFHYESDDNASEHSALISRYRYYTRLDPRSQGIMAMPDHVVPANFFSILPFDDSEGKQSSVVTIFSLWNTMMGTALLSMPWALQQAGLILGLFFMVFVAGLAFYTAYRVIKSTKVIDSKYAEFADVCRFYWGVQGEGVALIFSVLVLVGGSVVYWVLMSNFLYHTGLVIQESVLPNSTEWIILKNDTNVCDVVCAKPTLTVDTPQVNSTSLFDKAWRLQETVPFYLLFLAFPLLNFESPTFFGKFNVLGTISVLYLFAFVTMKATECGFHINFTAEIGQFDYVSVASWTFPALTGTLSLSYFLHCFVLNILRNQKNPENNVRDLSISYVLVAITYTYIGFVFFAAFPLNKDCISDNFLNNFSSGDLLSSVARLFLLFQMLAVFPLIVYLIRVQLSQFFIGKLYPGLKYVLALNISLLVLCIIFAVFYPSVGDILRFVGSICGLVYIFTLPSLVHMKQLKLEEKLTKMQILVHSSIIVLGVLNLVGQFALLGGK